MVAVVIKYQVVKRFKEILYGMNRHNHILPVVQMDGTIRMVAVVITQVLVAARVGWVLVLF